MSRIVVKYPPDFDGELWIEANVTAGPFAAAGATHWSFTFKHVETGGDAWSTLVSAAKAIVAQDKRRKAHHA